jgi:hypothetical protein
LCTSQQMVPRGTFLSSAATPVEITHMDDTASSTF